VLTAGSPAACHPSGKPYRMLNDDLKAIPEITSAQREILLDCARSFNERVKPEPAQSSEPGSGPRPGDDYNARGDSRADLERHGWRYLRPGRRGELWARPGVTHTSATRFSDGSLYVCSSNGEPFETEREYKPFSIRALLDFGGDYSAAAKALAGEGYGDQSKKKTGKKTDEKAGAPKIADGEEEAQTLSQLLIALARDNAELFHDAGGDAFLTATVGEHQETYRLGSRDSKDWLAGLLYRKTGRAASGDKITEALSVLRAIARHDSPEIETQVRKAGHDGAQ
jgi:hypothetical protein